MADRMISSTGGRGYALHPVVRHPVGRKVPDLLVVGDHVTFGDPPAEGVGDPLRKVFRRRDLALLDGDEVLDELVDAEEPVFVGQLVEAVLEGVFDVAARIEDLRIPLPPVGVLAEDREHEGEDLGIAGEEDVRAPDVERETCLSSRAAESPDRLVPFKNSHVVALFMEQAGQRNPGETTSQYRRFHIHTFNAEAIYG